MIFRQSAACRHDVGEHQLRGDRVLTDVVGKLAGFDPEGARRIGLLEGILIGVGARKGIADAMRDPQLIEEGERIGLELNFVSGTDVQAMVGRLYQAPADVTARAQAIATAN